MNHRTPLLLLLVAACADASAEPPVTWAALVARYPAVRSWQPDASSVERTEHGFRVRSRALPRAPGRWSLLEKRVVLDVPSDGDAMQVGLEGQALRVGVRRRASPAAPSQEDGALVARGAGLDAVIFAREARVEELVHLREGASVAYDLDLPAGYRLHRSAARPGLVEVRDARDTARLRLWIDRAWDASGREIRVDVDVAGSTVTAFVPDDAPRPVLIDPSWESAGTLTVPRIGHTATLLSDGRVLIAGGNQYTPMGGDYSELFDPAAGTFTLADGGNNERWWPTATLLQNGLVLYAGGYNPNLTFQNPELAVVERFDPATGVLSPAPPMNAARSHHLATLLDDGKVVVVGGGAGAPELYDPLGQTFTTKAGASGCGVAAAKLTGGDVFYAGGCRYAAQAEQLQLEPSWAPPDPGSTATLLHDGRVLVLGTQSYELFDPTAQTYASIPSAPPSSPSATLLADGRVLVLGGPSAGVAQIFDPTLDAVENADLPAAKHEDHTATLLADGTVLVLGGATTTAERYDPGEGGAVASVAVQDFGSAPDPSSTAPLTSASVRLPDGSILFAGGPSSANASQPVASAYLFDGHAVTKIADMKFPRAGHTMTLLLDGSVLVAGGGGAVPDEAFDPSTKTFHALASAGPQVLANHTATLLESGKVLLVGGLAAEVYDPWAGTYATTPELAPRGRVGHTATRLPDGTVLVAGGIDPLPPHGFVHSEVFDPKKGAFSSTKNDVEIAWHTATSLFTGNVFIAGGGAGPGPAAMPSAACHLFFPTSSEFDAYAALGAPRSGHTATLLPSGRVVLLGGFTSDGPTASAEVFDPISGAVAQAGALAMPHALHAATLLLDGRVLVGGAGDSAWETWGAPAAEDAWRPVIAAPPSTVAPNAVVPLTGTLAGASEGSTGTTNASASSMPVFVWMPNDGPPLRGSTTSWSATQASWTVPSNASASPGLVFVAANGTAGGAPTTLLAGALPGAACAQPEACASGFCVGGVCCEEACSAPCLACTKAGKGGGADGVCGQRPLGALDPACAPTTCGLTGACDASGQCARVAEGSSCGANERCHQGACTPNAASCDGDHTVGSGTTAVDCTPYRCSQDACLTACGSSYDCAEGYACAPDGSCRSPLQDDLRAPGCSTRGGGRSPAPHAALACVALALCVRRSRRRPRRSLFT